MRIAIALALCFIQSTHAGPIVINGLQYVHHVEKDGRQQGVFVNVDSVRRYKEYVKAWILKANSDDSGLIDVDGVGYTRALYVFNCPMKTLARKAVTHYTSAHELIDSSESADLQFASAVPASIGEKLLVTVCAMQPRRN